MDKDGADGNEDGSGVHPQSFETVFGVTQQELKDRGIDPSDYARKHIDAALKDPELRERINLPKSPECKAEWTKWGLRGYYAMFAGFGIILLMLVKPFYWPGLAIFSREIPAHATRRRHTLSPAQTIVSPPHNLRALKPAPRQLSAVPIDTTRLDCADGGVPSTVDPH